MNLFRPALFREGSLEILVQNLREKTAAALGNYYVSLSDSTVSLFSPELYSQWEHHVLEGAVIYYLLAITPHRNVEELWLWFYRTIGMILKSEGRLSAINLKTKKQNHFHLFANSGSKSYIC